ncbi:hypothetical protein [Arthrobacter sp. MMS24-S77]
MDPDREATIAGYNRACRELTRWLENATTSDLRRKSNGTRWTNEELLFHMVFGYMIVILTSGTHGPVGPALELGH